MREIEIKARVADMQKLLAELTKRGVQLSPPLTQHDQVFGPPGFARDSNWLRIRTENGQKIYFTLKKSIDGSLDNLELEVTVNNADEMIRIIRQIGYEPFMDITKVRQKTTIDDIEICVDDVKDLGTFIEAELLMPEDADHEDAVKKLWTVLAQFGVSRDSEVYEGYDVLALRARGNVPERYDA